MNITRLSTCIAGIIALTLCAENSLQAEEAATNTYTYSLPSNSINLYPDASWLPSTYRPYYTDLGQTIQNYTQQSLDRSGLTNITVSVQLDATGNPRVTLTGTDLDAMQAFAAVQQVFLDGKHAAQGLNGVQKCRQTNGCWDPNPNAQYPWAFFLPLGMAMINQAVVNFMNYPPAVSLAGYDYLANNTIKRWSSVLAAAGITNPVLYETIVDGRPIAAAGTGQSDYLPDIDTYFNSPGKEYVTPMLSLLVASSNATYSKAVVVLGAPAGDVWAKIIGASSVKPGDVGTTNVIDPGKKTNWVAGNHPNVTSYQCCPGDPSPDCQASSSHPAFTNLLRDEKIDLMVACIEKGLGENSAADIIKLKAECTAEWNSRNIPSKSQQALCIRARLDYSWNGIGNCKTAADALAFCKKHGDNACASTPQQSIYKCSE
jgi:hypothetical protein